MTDNLTGVLLDGIDLHGLVLSAGTEATLRQAIKEARAFNHNYVGTEHLLLALCHPGVTRSIASLSLRSLGVEHRRILRAVEFAIGRGDSLIQGDLRLTLRSRQVVELTADEAVKRGSAALDTEHLLLAIVHEGMAIGRAGILLERLGVNTQQLLERTLVYIEKAAMPIEVLDLSPGTYNHLKRAAVHTVGDLLLMSEEEILNVPGFNGRLFDDVKNRLAARGFPPVLKNADASSTEEGDGVGDALHLAATAADSHSEVAAPGEHEMRVDGQPTIPEPFDWRGGARYGDFEYRGLYDVAGRVLRVWLRATWGGAKAPPAATVAWFSPTGWVLLDDDPDERPSFGMSVLAFSADKKIAGEGKNIVEAILRRASILLDHSGAPRAPKR